MTPQPSAKKVSDTDSTATSSSYRIPLNILKQLAKDIEEAGGIGELDKKENKHSLLPKILDNKEIYKDIRGKLLKKAHTWLAYHKDGRYSELVLNRLGVKSAESLKVARRSRASIDESSLSFSADDESSEDSSDNSSVGDLRDRLVKKAIVTPRRERQSRIRSDTPNTPKAAPQTQQTPPSLPRSIEMKRSQPINMSIPSPNGRVPKNTGTLKCVYFCFLRSNFSRIFARTNRCEH